MIAITDHRNRVTLPSIIRSQSSSVMAQKELLPACRDTAHCGRLYLSRLDLYQSRSFAEVVMIAFA